MDTYRIEHDDTYWECTVQIDHEKADPAIKEMVEFWLGWEDLLDENDGDYTKTFLQNLAYLVLVLVIGKNYNLFGVTEEFKDLEGWVPLDGSFGIKLLQVESNPIDEDQFTVINITD
ncbi:MAG: DUF2528 family protein [Balneolaceae bacterium]